jgi:hypothetical protein
MTRADTNILLEMNIQENAESGSENLPNGQTVGTVDRRQSQRSGAHRQVTADRISGVWLFNWSLTGRKSTE